MSQESIPLFDATAYNAEQKAAIDDAADQILGELQNSGMPAEAAVSVITSVLATILLHSSNAAQGWLLVRGAMDQAMVKGLAISDVAGSA